MYRETQEDWTIGLYLLCFLISSIQFTVSKCCAGPNAVFDTSVNIIFTVRLDYKELGILVICNKIWLVVWIKVNHRIWCITFSGRRGNSLSRGALALWLWSPWSPITVTGEVRRISWKDTWTSIPFSYFSLVKNESVPIISSQRRNRCTTKVSALIKATIWVEYVRGTWYQSQSMCCSLLLRNI